MKTSNMIASVRWVAPILLAGCAVGPVYQKPAAPMPPQFKESASAPPGSASQTTPAGATWKTAQPSDHLPRGEWWSVFDDATLNRLETRALAANQGLAAAMARLKASRALGDAAHAGLFPTLSAGVGPTRQQLSPASQFLSEDASVPTQTLWRAQASASYEVDLFGGVSNSVNAARADAERSAALARSVQLALMADVAQNYFNLRRLDAESEILGRTEALRAHTLQLTTERLEAGMSGGLDVARAKVELASTRSDAMTVQRARAASEHSLAVLLGEAPAQFSLAPNPIRPIGVVIPAGLPSALLERRPDIAAAARARAAANARIGVAKAAFFPSLSLSGMAGYESSSAGNLFDWSSRTFVLGPLAGAALSMPLFDGGRRSANEANARAGYEEQVANYRQQVLSAFRETEDNLADLRILRQQTRVQADAVAAAETASSLSMQQYHAGAANYLDVIDVQRSRLQMERTAAQLTGIQAAATVNLIRALGGGWDGAGQDGGAR
jgi:multidrug efflux system outer membrane protein